MIPSARLRAIRKAGGTPTPPSFDKAVSAGYSSNTGSLSVVVANNGSVVFGSIVGDQTPPTACTFNSVAGTLLGSIKTSGKNYVYLYKWEGINAGTYNLAASFNTSWLSIAASVFYNVTNIGVATTTTGTSANMPTGASTDITLSAFGGEAALTVTSGTQATKTINDDKSVAMVYSASNASAHTVTNGQGSVSVKIAGPLVSFARQKMNKDGNFTINDSEVTVSSWVADLSSPATIVSNAIDVSGSAAIVTVHAWFYLGRNNVSGNINVFLNVAGTRVATYVFTDTVVAGNGAGTYQFGRACYLQWTGSIVSGDDITISVSRSISASGTLINNSHVYIESSNTTYSIQRAVKSTSSLSLTSTSRVQATGWSVDSNYSGGSIVSNSFVSTLTGTATIRARIVLSDTVAATCQFWLMQNGVDIGTVTFASGENGGKWISVPGCTLTGSDTIRLDYQRGAGSNRTLYLSTPSIEVITGPTPLVALEPAA